jgi:hypothetical protein
MRVQIDPWHDPLRAARHAKHLWSQFPSMQDQGLTDTEFILAKEVNAEDVFGVHEDVFVQRWRGNNNKYMFDMVKADGTVYAK